MIIFLYGQDTYRMKEKLNEIIGGYKKSAKSGFNLIFFGSENNIDINNFKNNFRQSSMFKEKKLYVLLNCLSDLKFSEDFLLNAKKFTESQDIIIFYEDEKINKSSKLFKFLGKNAKCQEFVFLAGSQLKNWVKKEAEKRGAVFEDKALDLLLKYTGADSWRLSSEIGKLASFCFSDKKSMSNIDIKAIESLVKPEIYSDIFKTIDAISEKDKKAALKMIQGHLEKGDNPLYLFSMINYQMRNVLALREAMEKNKPYAVISKTMGMHPFVARKSYLQAQKFSLAELKKIYLKIFQADVNMKTGKIEPELALDMLIAEM